MARKKPVVGVIGLGIIGSRVVGNLRKADFDVWVWNRSPRQEPNFLGSAKEVAETADIIQIFVSDGPALLATVEAMAPVLASRHVIINHATVSPDEVKRAAEIAAGSGAGFLDAPFTGSKLAAEAGQIVYYIGGSPEILERVRPVLSASSKDILRIGDIGQASLVKIVTNMVSAATVQVLAESLALMDKAGVPLETFVKAIELNAVNSTTAQIKLPSMVTGEFEAHFALKHMQKDVNLGLAEAATFNLQLPVTSVTSESLGRAAQNGWSDLDFSAISKHYAYPGKTKELASVTSPGSDKNTPGQNPVKRKSIFPLFGKRS